MFFNWCSEAGPQSGCDIAAYALSRRYQWRVPGTPAPWRISRHGRGEVRSYGREYDGVGFGQGRAGGVVLASGQRRLSEEDTWSR